MWRQAIIIAAILILLPFRIEAGDTTHSSSINRVHVGKDQATIQVYTCHASTAAALRNHVNHWLDSVYVELIDIQFEAVIVPKLKDTLIKIYECNMRDSSQSGHIQYRSYQTDSIKFIICGRPDTTITDNPNTYKFTEIYRAWITYRDKRKDE